MSLFILNAAYMSAFYLVFKTQQHWSIELLRTLGAVGLQQIRTSLLLVVFERMYAAVKLENYTHQNDAKLFWILNLVTWIISLMYAWINIYCRFLETISSNSASTDTSGNNINKSFQSDTWFRCPSYSKCWMILFLRFKCLSFLPALFCIFWTNECTKFRRIKLLWDVVMR